MIKTEELEKTLKEMQAEGRDLKVGIIGRVKAGKSSLLNALIFEGVEVLPKAATPMTASLTVLKYANTLNAEVEFYSPKDIAELKNEHERYVREFNRIVDEEVKKQKEKQSLSNRAKEGIKNLSNMLNINKSHEAAPKENILSDEEIVKRAERIAKDKLKGDEKLVSSHDQYEKIKKSGLFNTEKLDPRIQANSLQELNQKLLQFVGADGKYMPCTKAVRISLNNPNLKDLEVIDTPGVNDPIASREERTKALLKDCDVVFADDNNYRLQLDYSLKNLIELKRFKEAMNESYQSDLNDEKLQNDLREWRDLKNTPEEENYREFEEIKKMALYFRDYYMFCLDWYDLSQEKIQEYRDLIDRRNEMLQLDYSLRNLSILKGYKERNEKAYQDYLNDEELQNDLRKWKNGDKPGFFESLFNDLFGK